MDSKVALLVLYCVADLAAGVFGSFVLVSSVVPVRDSSLPLPLRAIRRGIEWRNRYGADAHVSVPGPSTTYALWAWRVLSTLIVASVMGLLLRNLVDREAEALFGPAVVVGTLAVLAALLIWVAYLLNAFRTAMVR